MIRAALLILVLAAALSSAHARGHGPQPLCPMGTAQGDACTSAPLNIQLEVGTFHPDFYTAYGPQSGQTLTRHNPYNLCGVDYPCGNQVPTAQLLDPATATLPPGCSYNATASTGGGPLVHCVTTAAAITFNGYNFGPVGGHGCAAVYVQGSAGPTVTFVNDTWINDTTCNEGSAFLFLQDANANYFISSDTFDGQTLNIDTPSTAAIEIESAGRCVYFQYNSIVNMAGRPMGGHQSSTCQFFAHNNYFEGFCARVPAGHCEVNVEEGTAGQDFSYNTFLSGTKAATWSGSATIFPNVITPFTNGPWNIVGNTQITNYAGGASPTGEITSASVSGSTLTVTSVTGGTVLGVGMTIPDPGGAGSIIPSSHTSGGTGNGSVWAVDSLTQYAGTWSETSTITNQNLSYVKYNFMRFSNQSAFTNIVNNDIDMTAIYLSSVGGGVPFWNNGGTFPNGCNVTGNYDPAGIYTPTQMNTFACPPS